MPIEVAEPERLTAIGLTGNYFGDLAATEETAKFADLPGTFGRIVVGEDAAGWTNYRDADQASPDFRPDGPTPAGQPLLRPERGLRYNQL